MSLLDDPIVKQFMSESEPAADPLRVYLTILLLSNS